MELKEAREQMTTWIRQCFDREPKDAVGDVVKDMVDTLDIRPGRAVKLLTAPLDFSSAWVSNHIKARAHYKATGTVYETSLPREEVESHLGLTGNRLTEEERQFWGRRDSEFLADRIHCSLKTAEYVFQYPTPLLLQLLVRHAIPFDEEAAA